MRCLPMANLSHEPTYIIDSTLAIAYLNNDNGGWNVWVDEHFRQNKKLYLLPMTVSEITKTDITDYPNFQILKYDLPNSDNILHTVYHEVVRKFNITGDRFKVNYQLIHMKILLTF